TVTKTYGCSGRADDVGEHDREQAALHRGVSPLSRDEVFDLGDDRAAVGQPRQHVDAGYVDDGGAGDVVTEERAEDGPAEVGSPDHQGAHLDRWDERGHVAARVQREQRLGDSGARTSPASARPPLAEAGVTDA